MRTLVLSVVILLSVVLLLPTVRAYVNQQGELRELRSQLAQAEAERKDLHVELSRWDDKNYVVKEARDHLNFVMPGDTVWRVLDADTVVDDGAPAGPDDEVDGVGGGTTPWYEAVWDSLNVSGRS